MQQYYIYIYIVVCSNYREKRATGKEGAADE
jgi:hypothetical protein